MKNKAVWLFPEFEKEGLSRISLALISEAIDRANDLSERVEACLIGGQVEHYIKILAQKGVNTTYLVEHELLSCYTLDAYTNVLSELINKHKPSIILFCASSIGNELAARVAARTKSNCVVQAESLMIYKNTFCVTKAGYNDKVAIYQEFSKLKPLILSMDTEYRDIKEPDRPETIQINREDIDFRFVNIRTKFIKFIKGNPRTLKLEEADRIVNVGQGLCPEQMPVVQKLADLIGASIGGTRAAVDEGIIPFDRQIGITGKYISPHLIINIALSGAREFTAGIEHANFHIAINTDKNAPIFKIADICCVGDARKIMDHLNNMLSLKQDEIF